MTNPKVSVLVITYNHVKFIGQALQSVLDQNANFRVEINVLDDYSTDGTRDVILDFKNRYPERINLFLNSANIGGKITQRNFYRGFKTLKGEYIAILEGDDYWTSRDKLQKQIDFLDGNSDFVACAHNVLKIYEGGAEEPHLFLPPTKEVHDIFDLISVSSYFHTTTLTYRNVFKGNPLRGFRHRLSCDLFLTIAHAQYGKIRFFPDTMSVYRSHPNGRFSTMSPTRGWMFNIDGLRKYNRWLGYRYLGAFASAIYRYCEYLLRHGKAEEGLSRLSRIKYRLLFIFYKALFEYTERSWLERMRSRILFRADIKR